MAATFVLRLGSGLSRAAYAAMVLADRPISYWRFGESAGTTATDQQGANPGTYHFGGGGLGWAGAIGGSGDSDTCLRLDGTSSYVSFAAGSLPDGSGPFSLEAWIEPFASNLNQTIYALTASATVNGIFFLTDPAGGGGLACYLGATKIFSASAFPNNVWSHVVATYDGATLILYLNGVQVASGAAAPSAAPGGSSAAIGRVPYAAADFFDGQIDEGAVYGYALTAAQVGAHYNAGISPATWLDLSSYTRVSPDDPQPMDPYSPHFEEPAFSETPYADGQALTSITVNNREQSWPLFLVDPTSLKDQLHALVSKINQAVRPRPLQLEWRDDGASRSTFYDVAFARFEPSFNFRRSQHGYGAGVLRVFTTGYGHTGTTRVCATAAGTGVFLSVPIGSVGGDAPAVLSAQITAGGVVPSLGRIIAIAPITQPSYAAQVPAASLTDLQVGATLVGASGYDGSQYLALPVSPTGGASGVACKVPLPNPTIAGGDNRILAVVQSGIDAGVGMYALDPYGNLLGPTAVASMSQSPGLVDLGVCRLPTTGYPTLPKISIYAGAIWASGAVGPAILASPGGLKLNEVLCLPDKNLALILESQVAGSVLSKDGFAAQGAPLGAQNDNFGNRWSPAYNNAHSIPSIFGAATGYLLTEIGGGQVSPPAGVTGTIATLDADHLAGILSDSMLLSTKAVFVTPSAGHEEVQLLKDVQPSQFVAARFAASKFLALGAATGSGGPGGNLLGSIGIATITAGPKYRLSLQVQGPKAFANLSRDDGGPVFLTVAPSQVTQASVGVASDAGVAGGGVPGLAISIPSAVGGAGPFIYGWQVQTIPSSNLAAYDSYTIDGVNTDSYRTSSAGAFSGQKLQSVQRGAYPKLSPSTVSLAVVAAAFDQGPANDLISAVISVKERFSYGR